MARNDEAPRKVHGPRVPGAMAKPTVKAKLPVAKSAKPYKTQAKAKDPVERSERHTARLADVGKRKTAKFQKTLKLKELIEPLTPSLIQVMSDIAHDKEVHAAVRLDAADRLLSRVYGKPKESLEIALDEAEAGSDEMFTLLNNILESVGAPLLESPKTTTDETGPREGRNAEED